MNSEVKTVTEEDRYHSSCRSVYYYSVGGLTVLSGAEIWLAIGFIHQLADKADAFTLMKTLFLIYFAGVFLFVSNCMREIFGELRRSDTPFLPDTAKKMHKLAGIFMIGGAAGYLFPLAGMIFDIPGSSIFSGVYALSGFMIAAGYVFNAFVFVFARGSKLQQESDETL